MRWQDSVEPTVSVRPRDLGVARDDAACPARPMMAWGRPMYRAWTAALPEHVISALQRDDCGGLEGRWRQVAE
jgi:hypothetical protein